MTICREQIPLILRSTLRTTAITLALIWAPAAVTELAHSQSLTVLHSFTGQQNDGGVPRAHLTREAAENWFITNKNNWSGFGVDPAAPRSVKVLIISMFKPEAEVWIEPLRLTDEIAVPGLSADYPKLRCNASEVCQLTTGMGYANAAASVTALIFSGRFDLSHTYFLIAGIAGIDPNVGTIGSATWPRYLIDFGIAQEIDAREMPTGWPWGYFGIETKGPGVKPDLRYRTEVFQLNERLLSWAVALSRQAQLDDNEMAKAYRRHYDQIAAKNPPSVIQCDTAASDTYWHGTILGERAEKWTSLLTDEKGRYCTTQQEDNATYEALRRGANANLIDIRRVAVLRTGANFDRPYTGQTAYASLDSSSGGFTSAIKNLLIAGRPLVEEIVLHWDQWSLDIPTPR
jgi:purine nucleoside permease